MGVQVAMAPVVGEFAVRAVRAGCRMTMTLATLRADAHACFQAALVSAAPDAAVRRMIARDGDALVLGCGGVHARHEGPVVVLGAGKAIGGMARAARDIVGADLRAGLVVAPHGSAVPDLHPVTVRFGAHPVPDEAGLAATVALLAIAERVTSPTLVLVLLSGGASALMTAPPDGVALADEQALTRALIAAGAGIADLNAVRKHCSRVKGGLLARATARAAGTWTLALSDVVGDALATIASGPTVADPTTYGDALAAIARYGLVAPASIATHLTRGARGLLPETPKPGDPAFDHARACVVGSNADAVASAAMEARRRGYDVVVEPVPLEGDAAEAGRRLARALLAMPPDRPMALVAGGETTVRAAPGGTGGRSQHLALAAAVALAGAPAVVLAAGTDGVDGPTTAAGACVDGATISRARRAGHDAAATLARTDAHPLLAATGDLVVTGPTGTNVADVVVALRRPA